MLQTAPHIQLEPLPKVIVEDLRRNKKWGRMQSKLFPPTSETLNENNSCSKFKSVGKKNFHSIENCVYISSQYSMMLLLTWTGTSMSVFDLCHKSEIGPQGILSFQDLMLSTNFLAGISEKNSFTSGPESVGSVFGLALVSPFRKGNPKQNSKLFSNTR